MAKTIEIGPYSAYAIAVTNGYDGTEEEWLASLVGPRGMQGASITGVKIDGNEHIIVTIHDPATNTDTTIDAGPIDNTSAVQSIQQAAQEALQQVAASTEAAQTAATQAAESASNAATSAQTAAEQANAAGESAGQAANSASSAGNSATAAAGSASAAKASETNAANSASTAQASEDKVHADATAATEAAEKAAASEQAAATSESNAAESAEQAQASETAAAGSATQAAASQAAASESADKAQQAASDAQSAAGEIDAGIIVESASGEAISVSDSANAKLRGLRIYGKSVQDGVPTLENPVEIESAGDAENISLQILGLNLINVELEQTLSIPNVMYEFLVVENQMYTVTMSQTLVSEGIGGNRQSQHWYMCLSSSGEILYESKICNMNFKEIGETIKKAEVFKTPKGTVKVQIFINPYFGASSCTVINNYTMVLLGNDVNRDYESYKPTQFLTYSISSSFHGLPINFNGNYMDKDRQEWICDEIDFGRGKHIQRIGKIDHYTNEDVGDVYMSTTGQLSDGATVIYPLETPIETDLPEEVMDAYHQLTMYYPNTTITTDSDPAAGVSVDYVADTKTYIDNKIAAISEAIMGGNT